MLLKPLAPITYLVRNHRKSLPLVLVIVLAVLLISAIVSMMNSIPLSIRTIYSYSKYALAVTPRGSPKVSARIRQQLVDGAPVRVQKVITCRVSEARVKSIVGKWPFVVLALSQQDMRYYLKRISAQDINGRLPKPGKPEMLVSRPVARNLKLGIGSTVIGPKTQESYSPYDVKVVGIADTEEWIMLAPIEYYKENHFPPIEIMLVMAKNLDEQAKLDTWALKTFKGDRVRLLAFSELEKDSNDMFKILYRILNVVIGMLILVITFMMALQMNIYQSQRLQEFGLLQALGYTKSQLLRRVISETLIVIVGGWLIGVAISHQVLNIVYRTLMHPNAFALNTADQTAYLYTVFVPISITIAAIATVIFRFRSFDPVSVVERRLV